MAKQVFIHTQLSRAYLALARFSWFIQYLLFTVWSYSVLSADIVRLVGRFHYRWCTDYDRTATDERWTWSGRVRSGLVQS